MAGDERPEPKLNHQLPADGLGRPNDVNLRWDSLDREALGGAFIWGRFGQEEIVSSKPTRWVLVGGAEQPKIGSCRCLVKSAIDDNPKRCRCREEVQRRHSPAVWPHQPITIGPIEPADAYLFVRLDRYEYRHIAIKPEPQCHGRAQNRPDKKRRQSCNLERRQALGVGVLRTAVRSSPGRIDYQR